MDGRELRAAIAGEWRSYNQTQPAIDQQKVILGKPGRPRLRESLGLTSHITVRILVDSAKASDQLRITPSGF